MILSILDEISNVSSTNGKKLVVKKHMNNELFIRVLQLTMDKVKYTYGIRKIPAVTPAENPSLSLEHALDFLENQLVTRKITGNSAITGLELIMSQLGKNDFIIVHRIISRDLKCGIGKTLVNSVINNCINKVPYMRCGVFNSKTSARIKYPCFIQQKMDGRYVSITVEQGTVTFTSRSGEEQEFPELQKVFSGYPDGVYMGELLVDGETDRAISNGMINSSEPPHDKIYVVLWDVVELQEFNNGSTTPYAKRFSKITYDDNKVKLVPYKVVNSKAEALQQVSEWMALGYEGGVLKDFSLPFKNHTSPLQLKIKLEVDCTVRITGFTEGTKGTSREFTFGAIEFSTDDGKIQGQTSGFTDEQLNYISANRKSYLGGLMDVTFNDLTLARDSSTYALSHPRFKDFRTDITDTDTLERVQELIELTKVFQ